MNNKDGREFVRRYDSRSLKAPYKSVRHIAIFTTELDAAKLASVLNISIYKPIGITTDEISTLVNERRAKYFYERKQDGSYIVYERLITE